MSRPDRVSHGNPSRTPPQLPHQLVSPSNVDLSLERSPYGGGKLTGLPKASTTRSAIPPIPLEPYREKDDKKPIGNSAEAKP
jgi:hypothetical protein